MTKYFVMHTPKKEAAAVQEYLDRVSPGFAQANAEGKNPAKCLKTWNPMPHGRDDCLFCLWEAEKPEDITASLAQMLDYLTADIMQVDETDWMELTKAVGA